MKQSVLDLLAWFELKVASTPEEYKEENPYRTEGKRSKICQDAITKTGI